MKAYTNQTTRRAVMLGSAGTLALAAPAGAMCAENASPDARLIALGEEFFHTRDEMDRADRHAGSFTRGSPAWWSLSERSDLMSARLNEIIEEAAKVRAVTPDGIRTKLTMVTRAAPFALRDLRRVADTDHGLAWSLVRDMAELVL